MSFTQAQLGVLAPVPVWDYAGAAARAFTYGGVLLAVGGAVFLAVAHDRGPERRLLAGILAGAALVGAVATILTVPLHAIEVSGVEAASGLGRETFLVSLESVVGSSALIRLVGLTVMLLGIPAALSARRPSVLLAGGLVAALSFLFAGHTVTAQPSWLIYVADAIHVIAASVWFGGLVFLAAVLGRRRRARDAVSTAAIVVRFSNAATVALVLVAAGGIALAWAEVRTFNLLTTTDYGRLLLLKLGLVALVVMLGAYNNRFLVPSIARLGGGPGLADPARAWQRLDLTVRLEAVGIVAVLMVTAVLVHSPPPRPYTDEPGNHGASAEVTTDEEVLR